MTAKRDFKRVVRERMAKTGETYTQARQALIKDTLSRIDELLAEFKKTEGDRIDREHLFIEAANLAATIHTSTREEGTFHKVFWLLPDTQKLKALENFLTEDELSTKDLAWALEQRLIYMAVDAMQNRGHSCEDVVKAHEEFFIWMRKNLDDASQAQAFCVPEVWYCWDQVGRQDEFLGLMESCIASIPAQQENKHDRMFLARNLLMFAARNGKDDDMIRLQGVLQRMIDEPGELPPISEGNPRLGWEGILQQIPLIAAGDDPVKAASASEACAEWIRSLHGEADWLMGEVAALCLFQGHYALAEKYAEEALDAGQGQFNPLIYMWRAGGHLGATGDVESTLPLVREARRHLSASEVKRLLDDQVPFTEYSDDQRLQEVVDMRG